MQHMMSPVVYFLLTSVVMAAIISVVSSYSRYFYTAAVFEHSIHVSNSSYEETTRINLAYYRNAANVAKAKGADIIVFPEYGLFIPDERDRLKKWLEFIPDPKYVVTNPCAESEQYSERPISLALSCIAKDNSLVVVANAGHIEQCQEKTGCPDDGELYHNTNVAFDSDGTLIGRYHKEHLFFELGMDLPRMKQDPTFSTRFGKFGMFTSFDIVFKRITEVAKQEVEAILLSAMWIDTAPFMTSVQLWQSWAMGNNITFMCANVHVPGHAAVGSGIFTGTGGPVAYTHNPDVKSKLIVAKVPRLQYVTRSHILDSSTTVITINGTESHENDGSHVPKLCSWKIFGAPKDFYKEIRCLEENTANYTFAKLNKREGHVEACNNGICCSVRYAATGMGENYYLGVYNGTYNMFDRYFWCQQNCLLVRCDAFGNNSCATFPMRSKTRFHYVYLTANITAEYVYPSVLGSGVRLVPTSDWIHGVQSSKAYVNYENASGRELLVVGLNGRCYSKDPPYIR